MNRILALFLKFEISLEFDIFKLAIDLLTKNFVNNYFFEAFQRDVAITKAELSIFCF